ncbi:MAG: hypothetical protein EOO99_02650 [Pedobacter sp.]|nr:MAG: hypothetical protein EOO99_02650 [Pedobacter sp.]
MRLGYSVKQKTKIAIFLFGVMVCIILIRVLEDKSVKELNKSVASLYDDRLIPATDLFYIAENLYAKRYLLNNIIENQDDAAYIAAIKKLGGHDDRVKGLMEKYEKTFLTTTEKQQIELLKKHLKSYNSLEGEILKKRGNLDEDVYAKRNDSLFNGLINQLTTLTHIQKAVGEELIQNSKFEASNSKIYSNIQFALATVIGILIVAVISTTNEPRVTPRDYNQN